VFSLAKYCHECGTALSSSEVSTVEVKAVKAKKPRKASAYSKKYGRAFKKVAKRYKKKNGSWKKNGFKLAQKAAHKEAKK